MASVKKGKQKCLYLHLLCLLLSSSTFSCIPRLRVFIVAGNFPLLKIHGILKESRKISLIVLISILT